MENKIERRTESKRQIGERDTKREDVDGEIVRRKESAVFHM